MNQVFSGVIGHEVQKGYLEEVLMADKLAHGYCFSGDEHLGKTLITKQLVAKLLKIDVEKLQSHPEVIFAEKAFDKKKKEYKNYIGVEEIRQLTSRLALSSFSGGTKVAIIENAELMNTQAQNALLKTLEEPSGKTLIIIIANKVEALLPTILSRVVHLRFGLVGREVICKELEKTLIKELAHELAGISAGRPGIAKALLDKEKREAYSETLEESFKFIKAPLANRLEMVEKIGKDLSKIELQSQLAVWRSIIHDCLLFSQNCEHLLSYSNRIKGIEELVHTSRTKNWAKVLEAIGETELSLRYNGNVTLALEHFVLAF